MKDKSKEPASPVVEGPNQDAEIRARWAWVEPTVWTDRMLKALEEGVKGGRWYSLMDKVCTPMNLYAGYLKVAANRGAAGIDRQTTEMFGKDLRNNIRKLNAELKAESYRPRCVNRVWIDKPGSQEKRPLGIPTVRDRVVQTALRNVLEPIFEKEFAEHSYGFRPKRGCKDALRRVERLLKEGYVHVVDADLKSYFDTIPHEQLLKRIEGKVSDGKVIELITHFLKQGVMDGLQQWTPEQGTPQGAVLSPLLSNIYLDELDHLMVKEGVEMIRYADDFVLMCRSKQEAQRGLEIVQQWVTQAGLTLHPEKTRIVNAEEPGGFDFLGYHFERGTRWPREKSRRKFQDRIRMITRRNRGVSLERIILQLNPTLRGWFEYFKHSNPKTFKIYDGWIRMRLRSILRKRSRRRGRGIGPDHIRWPNAHFIDRGLFTMTIAHATIRQSSR